MAFKELQTWRSTEELSPGKSQVSIFSILFSKQDSVSIKLMGVLKPVYKYSFLNVLEKLYNQITMAIWYLFRVILNHMQGNPNREYHMTVVK